MQRSTRLVLSRGFGCGLAALVLGGCQLVAGIDDLEITGKDGGASTVGARTSTIGGSESGSSRSASNGASSTSQGVASSATSEGVASNAASESAGSLAASSAGASSSTAIAQASDGGSSDGGAESGAPEGGGNPPEDGGPGTGDAGAEGGDDAETTGGDDAEVEAGSDAPATGDDAETAESGDDATTEGDDATTGGDATIDAGSDASGDGNIIANPSCASGTSPWYTFSSGGQAATLEATTTTSHDGTSSCWSSNRMATFEGPSQDILSVAVAGQTYTTSAWVMVRPGDGGTTTGTAPVELTVVYVCGALDAGTNSYITVASANVNIGTWTELSGSFSVPTCTDLSLLIFYAQGPAVGLDLFVGDASAVP